MDLTKFDLKDRILIVDSENCKLLKKAIKNYDRQLESARKNLGEIKNEARLRTSPIPLLEIEKDGKTTIIYSSIEYKKVEISINWYFTKLEKSRSYYKKKTDKVTKHTKSFSPLIDKTISEYLS